MKVAVYEGVRAIRQQERPYPKPSPGEVTVRIKYVGICGTEILCTKAGEGKLTCCDQEMQAQEPRPVPSSD